MSDKMTNDLKVAFVNAKNVAIKYRDNALRIEHVIYGILRTDNQIKSIAIKKVKDFDLLMAEIELFIKQISVNDDNVNEETILFFDKNLIKLIKNCSEAQQVDEITPELLFSLAFNIEEQIFKIIKSFGLSKTYLMRKIKENTVNDEFLDMGQQYPPNDDFDNGLESNTANKTKNNVSILDNYGRDLIKLAQEKKLDPVIGRTLEVERIAQILSRRKKNNPLIIGDAGVGKTALIESLAIKILNGDCPRPLIGKKLYALDITSLVAGTKYRGQFEERIKQLLDEVKNDDDIIIFIDEIHTLVGAGNSSGSLDAANVFKPALARGEIKCIGATTQEEYHKHIEKDNALDRRFQKINVLAPSIKDTEEILMKIKVNYEKFHNVTYTDEAIKEIVRLCDRYITDRNFPDKAIDVLDEAGSRAQINQTPPKIIVDLERQLAEIKQEKIEVVKTQNFERAVDLRDLEKLIEKNLKKELSSWDKKIKNLNSIVDVDSVFSVVSAISGIPITRLTHSEIEKISNLDQDIEEYIIGQSEAVKKVALAIKRNRVGIRKQNKPIGSFLFIGPSGVGKTQLAKELAKNVFGSEDYLIRLDMSEYSEKFNISKLIGAPPGYVGYSEGGQLTQKIKKQPYSVVLFDEIEKAHPEIFNVLLQLLDEGHLTDSDGKKINFKNTIIIMTSNIGLKQVQDFGVKIGFNSQDDTYDNAKSIIEKALKKTFKPEFLNRLDDIIYFNYLSEDNIMKIINIQLNQLSKHLNESGYQLIVTNKAKKYIFNEGFHKEFGAREIARTIQKYVEDKIADVLLKNNIPQNVKLHVDVVNDKISVKIK